jgi:nucleoside 2-deoxyribosyltransferase
VTARPTVYLACPMNSRPWGQVIDAQRELHALLTALGVDVFSPVNGLDLHMLHPGGSAETTGPDQPWTTPTAFVSRDLAMIRRADAILADVRSLHHHTPSLGLTFELGFAAALSKPVLYLWADHSQPCDAHPFWAHGVPGALNAYDPHDATLALAQILSPGLTLPGLDSPLWKRRQDLQDAVSSGALKPASSRDRASGRLSVQAEEQGTRGAGLEAAVDGAGEPAP